MISAAVLDALVAAGASTEMIVAAVKADAREEENKAAEKRAKDAARQRKSRMSRGLAVTSCDSGGHGVTGLPPKEKSPTPPKEITPIQSSLRSESARAREAFAEFRDAYPRRQGSQPWAPAEKKFLALVAGGQPASEIISGARAYAIATAADDPRFVAQAITWLNQSRWKDEHTAPNPMARGSPPPKRLTEVDYLLAFAEKCDRMNGKPEPQKHGEYRPDESEITLASSEYREGS